VTVRSLPRPKAKGNAEFSLFAGCNAELSVAQYRECGRKGRKKNTTQASSHRNENASTRDRPYRLRDLPIYTCIIVQASFESDGCDNQTQVTLAL